MEAIQGFILEKLPINGLRKISDLIYFEGPLLSHFQNSNDENYLFYWIDIDSTYNRWLVFRVSPERLQAYLNRKISLFNLVSTPDDNFIYKVDINAQLTYENVLMLFPENIPLNYLPEKNTFYDFPSIYEDLDLESYSSKYKTGILQTYFKNSAKVPYNEIDIDIFGPMMNYFHEITSGLGKAYVKKRIKSLHKDTPKPDVALLRNSTRIHYFAQAGGSFSALFKSASNEIPMEGVISDEDMFIKYLIEFFSASEDFEKLSEFVKTIDKKIISSYKNLLQTIIQSELKFYVRYENVITKIKDRKDLNFNHAGEILNIIEKLEYDEKVELNLKGRFTALNIKTGQYEFEDSIYNENISKGKLDKERKSMAYILNFNKIYEVKIERRETKKAGNKTPRKEDILISFIEIIPENE